MKKIPAGYIQILMLLVIMSAGVLFAVEAEQSNPPSEQAAPVPQIIAGPYLQHVTQTTLSIMWETDSPCDSKVAYGQARVLEKPKEGEPKPDAPLDRQAVSKPLKTIHEITLDNLEVQTDYFYRVESSDETGQTVQSDILAFQTAVRDDSAFSFVAMGDTRTYPDRFEKICKLAWAERPNFVIHMGDVVSNGQNKQEWIDEFLAPAKILMQQVPLYVAIGNHERNADWYYKYVSYPSPENYYSFDFGNAHFTIIDNYSDCSEGSVQYQWLLKDLASTDKKWKFVAHHAPPFSSDSNDYGDTARELSRRGDPRTQHLIPLYEKYGVDIVWCGHIHTYERTWPIYQGKVDQNKGVIYIQAGGGAAELEEFAPTRSYFTAKLARRWQYCLINIHKETFQMMTYDIDGNLFDYLELKK